MFQAEGMAGAKFLSREQREKELPSKEVINFSVQKPLLKFVCLQKQNIWSFKKKFSSTTAFIFNHETLCMGHASLGNSRGPVPGS